MDELPHEVDLLIIGTGFIESLVSAAASRIGKSVLHLDTDEYYGGQWGSFNLQALVDYNPESPEPLAFKNNSFSLKNFNCKWLVEDQKEDLLKNSRKFNIDLTPKLHFCRGDFVQLLITSNIARYSEFRSVTRILTWLNGQLELVPCSRSDVFASQKVSVVEKRVLMKLLTSLDQIIESENTSNFKKFLISRKLSDNLVNYVLAMAGASEQTGLKEAVKNVKRFLDSLGRFGKTPYLFSMYGSGEIAQAFCRLSAVFGGIYALNQQNLISLDLEDKKIASLTTTKQQIRAENFVTSLEKCSEEFLKPLTINNYISRAVLITNKSILPSEQEQLSFLIYPEGTERIINVFELGHLTGTCPKDYYLVHLTTKQSTIPQEDFKGVLENLFSGPGQPQIIFSCYFSVPETSNLKFENVPGNLFLCPGPDNDLDYDLSIQKAKEIFEKMYPDLEFLPRAPDPEEIIIGD